MVGVVCTKCVVLDDCLIVVTLVFLQLYFSMFVFLSLCSGFVATIFSTPADVVKSRMMNQPFDRDGRCVCVCVCVCMCVS